MDDETSQTSQETLESEMLELLAKQGRMAPVPVFFAMSLVASFVVEELPVLVWVGWLFLVGLMMLIRMFTFIKLRELSQYSASLRLKLAVSFSAINGIIHGLILFAFPLMTEFERATLSLFLVGTSAISVISTAGFLPMTLAYMIPTMMPITVLWAISPGAEPNATSIGIAIMHFLYIPILIKIGRDTFEIFKNSVESRHQQALLNLKLEEALDEARLANRSKTRFLAAASHDLRQPIHTLSLFTTALTMRDLDNKSREITGNMNIAVQNLANQLDALLDISKLDAGVIPVNHSVLRLDNLIGRLCTELKNNAEQKELDLRCSCDETLYVESDEILLERILRNLIGNAIKYTHSGEISVSVKTRLEHYCITIEDTGPGIPESEQKSVFEEFYQLDNPERDRTKGLGLGLAIVKRLIDLLELEITLYSEVGKGTRFEILIDRKQPANIPNQEREEKTVNWSDMSVLVVDDERQVRIAMEELLTTLGCKVFLADSGKSSEEIVASQKPDILLVDYQLKGGETGIDVIKHLRTYVADLPAIIISGGITEEQRGEISEADIEFLYKPVPIKKLSEAIIRNYKN